MLLWQASNLLFYIPTEGNDLLSEALNNSNIEYWANNYTIEALAKKIDNIIH